ncbi:MAG: nuclease-related domain-containing protein [Sarcina sp.]
MGIFKFLKNLFSSKEVNGDTETSVEILESKVETNLFKAKDKQESVGKSFDEELRKLRRVKYSQSSFNLENRLEYEVLNYLVGKESSEYNVYWNLYIPYGINKHMQIDHLVVTGNTIYSIECKDLKTCTSIEAFAEHWECYYNSGKVFKNSNGADQNRKHIDVLRKYLKNLSFEYKSIVVLVVDDCFKGYLPNEEIILVRNKEFDLVYKLLDRKVKASSSFEITDEFIRVNKKIYECMNPSDEVVKSHRDYIEERYK